MSKPRRRFSHIPSTVYLVKAAEAVNRMHTDRILRGGPLTTMQYVALGVLEARGGLTAAELARRSFVAPQSMQDTVKSLESKGMIERTRSETNRRELLIGITGHGRGVMEELEPEMAELNDAILAGFSDAEVEMFRSLLQRARRNAAHFQPDAGTIPAESAG